MVNVARKREWKLASDILLTESFLTVFSQVEIPLYAFYLLNLIALRFIDVTILQLLYKNIALWEILA